MAVADFASRGGEAWVSAVEHPCMIESVRYWFLGRYRLVPVEGSGVINLSWLEEALRSGSRPSFVAIMAANNETGILQPWREATALCESHGVPFFCDASQWLGKKSAGELGRCAALVGCGHKFGGPQGVGFLKSNGSVTPLLRGGPQEAARRAGTENVAGILSMVAALEDRDANTAEFEQRVTFRDSFEAQLRGYCASVSVIGADVPRLWNTSAVVMPEIDCRQRWVVKLDRAGCAVSTGSACASGKEQASHVLSAMGLSVSESARVLRFSSGWDTTEANWQRLLTAACQALGSLKGGC